MTGNVTRRTPQARQDILELAEYIAQGSLDNALRFLDAAEVDMARLAEMPGLGRRREFSNPMLDKIRSWAIRGFPNHLIFYRPVARGIEVVRVLHGARDIELLFEE